MTIISHRGNINGPSSRGENHPASVDAVLRTGYDCEIDVWYIKGSFLLGHDHPIYKIKEKFLENPKLWCHAKNLSRIR